MDAPLFDAKDQAGVPPAHGIRVGIGGWTFAPWRDDFYPAGLVQRRELEYASRMLSAIEINGTFHRAQKPATYAKWASQVPAGFVFSVKAPMRIVQARELGGTGGQVEAFLAGITALGDTLGPIVWQFDRGGRLRREDLAAFVDLLPASIDGRVLRHVLDVRDPGVVDAGFLALARRRGIAFVFTDSTDHPSFADTTADFVYARLMRARADVATGYRASELAAWARRARTWADGGEPDDLPRIAPPVPGGKRRDVFIFFISAAKERNPAAAMALIRKLQTT